MEAMGGSPNWYWNRLGAVIEKHGKAGLNRRISINGKLICDAIGHAEEIEVAKIIMDNSNWVAVEDAMPEVECLYELKKTGFSGTREGAFGEIDGRKGFYNFNGWVYPTHWRPTGAS
jgi:hypothetical protein